MPSGRDSFRRNRVAPSVQLYFSTSAQPLGGPAVIPSKFWVKRCHYVLAPHTRFRVNVASKRVSLCCTSLVRNTCAGGRVKVAGKGLSGRGEVEGWKVKS